MSEKVDTRHFANFLKGSADSFIAWAADEEMSEMYTLIKGPPAPLNGRTAEELEQEGWIGIYTVEKAAALAQ